MDFKNKLNPLKNSDGSAIAMVLAAISILAVYALLIGSKSKIQNRISINEAADKDIERAVALVSSTLMSPNNCNANFYPFVGPPLKNPNAGTLPALYKCISAATCHSNANITTLLPVIASNSTDWNPSSTQMTSTRARLVGLGYTMETSQYGIFKASLIKINMTFQKNMGTDLTSKLISVSRYVNVYVIENGTQFLGCPRGPQSFTVY